MLVPIRSPLKPDAVERRVALVTGGGSGIGFEIARQLMLHGAKVVIMGRREAFLQQAVALLQTEGGVHEGAASWVQGDVRRTEDALKAVEHTLATFGSLDILVNAAAGNFLVTAEDLSAKGFRTVLEIDTVGVFNMSRAAFKQLKRKEGSQDTSVIINISATLHYGATWFQTHASAAKAAIDSLTRSLGLEWGSYGIRVIGIAPGPIADTPGMTKLAPSEDKEMIEEAVKELVPIGRMGRKEDIAFAAVFLCTPAASFITGETIVIDGAHWIYKPPMIPRDMVAEMSRAVEAKSRAMAPNEGKSRL